VCPATTLQVFDIQSAADWYNNEHVPLRLNHIPEFLTGARYQAADDKKPGWIALYDTGSPSIFQHPSYTRLRETRSPREAALVKRLDVLDRRMYEVVLETDMKAGGLSTGLAMGNPTQWIVTHGLDIDQEHSHGGADVVNEIWQTIVAEGNRVPSLLRSQLLKCIENSKSGVTVSSDSEAQRVSNYFVLHGTRIVLLQFTKFNTCSTEMNASSDLKPMIDAMRMLSGEKHMFKISEERGWKLYRAYPSIAQGNLP